MPRSPERPKVPLLPEVYWSFPERVESTVRVKSPVWPVWEDVPVLFE
jgi:hypothetical protein